MASLYRNLAELLLDAGCRFERQGKGSHEIWVSPITNRTFTVPSNIDNRPLANAILKQAGLPKAF
jgi:predicted RNA binding protein YcfA (HicA-like mRNA interferase family)